MGCGLFVWVLASSVCLLVASHLGPQARRKHLYGLSILPELVDCPRRPASILFCCVLKEPVTRFLIGSERLMEGLSWGDGVLQKGAACDETQYL